MNLHTKNIYSYLFLYVRIHDTILSIISNTFFHAYKHKCTKTRMYVYLCVCMSVDVCVIEWPQNRAEHGAQEVSK